MKLDKFTIIGIVTTLLGLALNRVEAWASEKELDAIVEEKVNMALAKKEGES